MSTQPVILIYNPIPAGATSTRGTHCLSRYCLERGWRVLALTQDHSCSCFAPRAHRGLQRTEIFKLLNGWPTVPGPSATLEDLMGALGPFRRHVFIAARVRNVSTCHSANIERRVCQVVVPVPFRLSHYLYRRYRRLRSRGIKASPLQRQEIDRDCPADMSRRVSAALKKAKWSPAVAFNMYMDTYTTDQSRWDEFAGANRLRWAGIRFVPPPAAG